MDELQRRALARLPLSEEEVRAAYHCRGVDRLPEYEYLPGGNVRCPDTPETVGKLLRIRGQLCASVTTLCESHERLRAELEGTTTLLRDAEADAARLSAEVERLRGTLERISAGVRFPADLAAETLAGEEGETDE